MVNEHETLDRFERRIAELFSDFGKYSVEHPDPTKELGHDLLVRSEDGDHVFVIEMKSRDRITPQLADSLFKRLNDLPVPRDVTLVVFAPVISDRVAEIARQHDVSYMDHAGNCLIKNEKLGLFVSVSGKRNPNQRTRSVADIFSPKSSRIVRTMLREPSRRWKVRELAEHPDINISMGLASRIKDALIHENYATEEERLLKLKDPEDLLNDWGRQFKGSTKQRQFYVRGDLKEVEQRISDWCVDANHEHALARFSAAWRLAPEVRYNVASLYVDPAAVRPSALKSLRSECGAREVDSGANLTLLTPYDESVFIGSTGQPRHTSAVQTWLDLQSMSGRGEEAAAAIYDKYLRDSLDPHRSSAKDS